MIALPRGDGKGANASLIFVPAADPGPTFRATLGHHCQGRTEEQDLVAVPGHLKVDEALQLRAVRHHVARVEIVHVKETGV